MASKKDAAAEAPAEEVVEPEQSGSGASGTTEANTGPVHGQTVNPDTEDNALNQNGYVGTDPIYQNHANDTEAPL